ncbi:unnamed protein product [Meganyctiphanes norvegica]|uniref:Uncharacterized protein n=1 Tax=Meganyctiphanes norvegica TaxID=48144 RepID=A0AAV2PYY5_MEGNR
MATGRCFKIVTVGDGTVGKTCVLIAYTQNAFPVEYVPTVFENYSGDITVDDRKYGVNLWDTAGQEGYDRVRLLAYNGTNCFLVCFSVVDKKSFENVTATWLPEIRQQCPNIPVILVGTKSDLRGTVGAGQEIMAAEAKKLASREHLVAYVETSAKKFENLNDVFIEAVKASEAPPKKKAERPCSIL